MGRHQIPKACQSIMNQRQRKQAPRETRRRRRATFVLAMIILDTYEISYCRLLESQYGETSEYQRVPIYYEPKQSKRFLPLISAPVERRIDFASFDIAATHNNPIISPLISPPPPPPQVSVPKTPSAAAVAASAPPNNNNPQPQPSVNQQPADSVPLNNNNNQLKVDLEASEHLPSNNNNNLNRGGLGCHNNNNRGLALLLSNNNNSHNKVASAQAFRWAASIMVSNNNNNKGWFNQ
jgi:hypothetical protein